MVSHKPLTGGFVFSQSLFEACMMDYLQEHGFPLSAAKSPCIIQTHFPHKYLQSKCSINRYFSENNF